LSNHLVFGISAVSSNIEKRQGPNIAVIVGGISSSLSETPFIVKISEPYLTVLDFSHINSCNMLIVPCRFCIGVV